MGAKTKSRDNRKVSDSERMSLKMSGLHGIGGLDEAGRGPMIGPLVVCGLLIEPDELHRLENIGLKDSKVLSAKRRMELCEPIRELAVQVKFESLSARDIDESRKRGTNLNDMEVEAFSKIVRLLRPAEVFLDAADVKAERFGERVSKLSGLATEGIKVISEHKADAKYPIVSAASILAKVERDTRIEEFHQRYGDFGSGYPSDPKTVEFVRGMILDGKKLPPIVRQSWESVRRIYAELEQSDLTSF